MKIAIIGSGGYIGRTLCRLLEGHDLLRIDAGLWGDPPEGTKVAYRWEAIRSLLSHFMPESVVVLAAAAHDPRRIIPGRAQQELTTITPSHIADWCAENGAVCTVASSLSVFDENPGPGYPYAKRELEKRIAECHTTRLNTTVLRFGTLFGAGDDVNSFRPHLLLNSMVFGAVSEGVIPVSKPMLRRPTTSMRKAASSLAIWALDNNSMRGEIRNVYEHCDTLIGYARRVQAVCGGVVDVGAISDGDVRDYGKTCEVAEAKLNADIHDLATWTKHHAAEVCIWRRSCWDNLQNWMRKAYS